MKFSGMFTEFKLKEQTKSEAAKALYDFLQCEYTQAKIRYGAAKSSVEGAYRQNKEAEQTWIDGKNKDPWEGIGFGYGYVPPNSEKHIEQLKEQIEPARQNLIEIQLCFEYFRDHIFKVD